MKKDNDLIRDILLEIEKDQSDPLDFIQPFLPDRDRKAVAYNLLLLKEAGFIVGEDVSTMAGTHILPQRLTYQGHELLDAIRDKEIWNQTKEKAKAGGVEALSFVWEIAKAVGKSELKRRTGMEF